MRAAEKTIQRIPDCSHVLRTGEGQIDKEELLWVRNNEWRRRVCERNSSESAFPYLPLQQWYEFSFSRRITWGQR
ncbi:hypothetical protein MRB53_006468 [Persea americana]|uniref:Uncharacterized protein n=1 Tax=Persea americana TaxID=3435 RepID=A0ACC2MH19_PERAE|nr:hypothetical protein MRB53_006468 [Persea americana]